MSNNLTTAEARDEILTLFKDGWDANGLVGGNPVPVYYWDVTTETPNDDYWVRIIVRHTNGGDDAIGGRFFRRTGTLTLQIFSLFGEGLSNADDLANIALAIFQGESTTGGVWFRNVRYTEIGQDGKWFNGNVLGDFEYNQIKASIGG